MRPPWVQIETEFIQRVAGDLGALLAELQGREPDDRDEAVAGWGVEKLILWWLGRCPDEDPPSKHDVVRGPGAARLIARAAGHRGDPEVFVRACTMLEPPLLEQLQDGWRLRGLKRYDAVWAKNRRPKSDRPDAGTEPGRNTPPTVPEDQDRDLDQDLQKPPPPASPRARNVVPLRTQKPEEEADSPFWEFTQQERAKLGRGREEKPAGFARWARETEAEVGPERLSLAYSRFLLDDHFRMRGWPMPVFQRPKVWRPRANDLRNTS